MAIFSWTKSKKSRAFLEFQPYSAFNFGGRNRKAKAENFPFRPKVLASGIPLIPSVPILVRRTWDSQNRCWEHSSNLNFRRLQLFLRQKHNSWTQNWNYRKGHFIGPVSINCKCHIRKKGFKGEICRALLKLMNLNFGTRFCEKMW